MTHFFKSERGYALVLTLLFMPVFIGISLLVIDIGRGNNAQGDHQAAADALALAGARELDGRTDAISRAKAAMATLDNTVSFLGADPTNPSINLIYEDVPGNTFTVIFLDEIPPSDDTPIDQAWADDHATADPTAANFVYVYSRSSDLRPFFFNPATRTRQDIPIAAKAVATYTSATCDLTPLFICTTAIQGKTGPLAGAASIQEAFARGELYGRLQKLRFQEGSTAGNFGFLQIDGNDTPSLTRYLAGKRYGVCKKDADTVDTQTGAREAAVRGFNTRFDIYFSQQGDVSRSGIYSPATLVRKGFTGKTCDTIKPPTKTAQWQAAVTFSDDVSSASSPTGYTWNFDSKVSQPDPTTKNCTPTLYNEYWQTLYNGPAPTKEDYARIIKHPAMLRALANATQKADFPTPSRYDVYKYELEQMAAETLSLKVSPETSTPLCYNGSSVIPNNDERRTMYVALVDCTENILKGSEDDVPVALYAKIFLPKPLPIQGQKTCEPGGLDPLVIEVTDISGPSGNGSVDLFLRQEAYLVR